MFNNESGLFITIGIHITFFGFGLDVLQAIELLFSKNKRSIVAICFFICNSIYLFFFGLFLSGVPQQHPQVFLLFFTSLFALGPVNYFYYHELLFDNMSQPYDFKIHLIPAFICFTLEVVFHFQPLDVKLYYISSFFAPDPTNYLLLIIMMIALLHLSIYLLYIIKVVISDIDIRKSRNEFKFIVILASGIFLNIIIFLIGFLGRLIDVFVIACISNVIIHISIYLAVRIFPRFFSDLKIEMRKKRYEKSMLKGLDTEVACNRLLELMQDEEIFTDNDISLSIVAGKLNLSNHQLSQLLNEHMNFNFWDFINQFRVEKAKEILIKNPGASIISTCYRVGFNNKSSFNAAFKKWASMTPTEFRNEIGNNYIS